MVDRLTGVIIPTLTTFLLIFKLVPGVLRLRLNLSLQKLYRRLEELEKLASDPGVDITELLSQADSVDEDSLRLWVPRSQASAYLELRQFVHDMRERLSQRDK